MTLVGKSVDIDRNPRADRHAEFTLDERVNAAHGRAAAGDEGTGVETMQEVGFLELLAENAEQFAQTRVDDRVERAAGDRPRFHQRRRAGNLDARLAAVRADHRRGVADLQLFGLGLRRLERMRDVVRDVVAADADDACVGEITV